MKKHFLLFLIFIFMCTFIGNISSAIANSPSAESFISPESFIAPDGESYVFDLKWGTFGTLNDEFNQPHGITVDQAGDIWVTDYNNRILKFDPSGNFLLSIGGTGSGPGQLNNPLDIAVDASYNIWVAEWSNGRVQKLNSLGQQICQVGGLSNPSGIAIDRNTGNVYISNVGSDNITKIDSSCAIIGWLGGPGSGNGQFNNPYDIAVDSVGNIFVADYSNQRIQKFDSNGVFITKWGVGGSGDSRFTLSPEFNGPIGIEVDYAGDIFVTDHSNHRIQKFDNNGTFITMWGWFGYGNGQFYYPWGITIDGMGRVYVADRDNHRIQRFSPSNTNQTWIYKWQWGSGGPANGQFSGPLGTVTDNLGNLYVADHSNHRIQKFDANGSFLLKWGASGNGNSQFRYPLGIAIDNTGNIYVADRDNHRIQKFDSTGVFIMGIGNGTVWSAPAAAPLPASGTGNGYFNAPQDVAVDLITGDIYVTDLNNNRIQKFNSAGVFVMGVCNGTTWTGLPPACTYGNQNRWFNAPYTIALDVVGDVYIGERNNHRIQKLDYLGNFITKWGTYGSGNGQFNNIDDMVVDGSGNIFVAEWSNNRIQEFNSFGRFISKWSSGGNGVGQFNQPWGLALSPDGDFLYVSDYSNNRVQKFERFGFSFTANPNTKTVASGDIATYSIDVTGEGQNTLGTTVSFYVLSGLPSGTTWDFAPASVTPSSIGIVSSTLSLDTSPTTPVGTYTVYIEVEGGGQTRIIPITLKVIPKITNFKGAPNPFSPNADTKKDTTNISANFTVPLNWTLNIKQGLCPGTSIIRTFTGSGSSLSQIWDGKDTIGNVVSDGKYCYSLSGKDAGNVYSNPVTFTGTVDTVKPVISFVSDGPDPFQHHLGQTTTINYTLSENAYVRLRVYSGTTLIRTLVNDVSKSSGPNNVIWDGRDNSNVLVPAGTYEYKIWAQDPAGNYFANPVVGTSTAE